MGLKLTFFPVLLVAACVFSAAYGALHNQISYTVSPEFFFSYQFGPFDIPMGQWNRVGATLVGIYSAWWMGLIIGPPVLLVGLILSDWKAYLKHTLIAFGVVTGTALLVGLVALTVARFSSPSSEYWASAMHDYGYLGGCLGIVTGSLYLVSEWARQRKMNRA